VFDSKKQDLRDILERVHTGKLQLPDFQRDYVWSDPDVRSLIASIAKGFPVGALLTLEAGSEVAFKPRLLEGVPDQETEHQDLLLDGQQRITSLYQVMYSDKPVKTKLRRKTFLRYYYLDIKKVTNADADLIDSIVPVPEDRVVRTNFNKDIKLDLTKPEHEFEKDMFPLNHIFDSKDWFFEWRGYWRERGRDIYDLERDFDKKLIDVIGRYKMPIIELDSSNSRDAICLVFEKVNIGGKKLDAFELLTAIYAADDFDLREEWGSAGRKKSGLRLRLIGKDNPRRVLKRIQSTDYLQACTLLHTRDMRLAKEAQGVRGLELPQITCKRQAMLGLPLAAYKKYTNGIEQGFIDAASFLSELKIMSPKDLPYASQIITLASVYAILGHDAHNAAAKKKLVRWFWCGALGEMYGSASESRMARDVPAIVKWITDDGPPPPTVEEASFRQNRLRRLRSRKSAAYKAVNALLMSSACRDFVSGDAVELMNYFEREIDVHHIFPQKWCKARNIEREVFDSIINKTPLSKRSNIRVGGNAPSRYLQRIEETDSIPGDMLDAILASHQINPALLRADDFEAFYADRTQALCDLISKAMGKPVATGQPDDPEIDDDPEDDEEEPDENNDD